MRPRIVFMHIPKCAGGSLTSWLMRQYPEEEVFNCGHDGTIHTFLSMPQEKRDRIRLLCGHVYYGIHHQFSSYDEVDYITMLRDPVERTISQYWFMRNKGPDFPFYKAIRSMSPADFIRAGMNPFLHNPMTHILSGCHRDSSKRKEEMKIDALCNMFHKVSFVGFTANFDGFLGILCQAYSFEDKGYTRQNVSEKGTMSPDDLAAVKEVSELDTYLYTRIADKIYC